MKRLGAFSAVACVALSLLLSQGGYSQDKEEAPAKTSKAEKKGKKAAAKGRLPANFAKLELKEEQKTKIYDIQAKFHADIEKLQAQLNDLKAKEHSEIAAVLTAEQKTKLEELIAASKQKRDAKKAGDTKDDGAEKKDGEKPDAEKKDEEKKDE